MKIAPLRSLDHCIDNLEEREVRENRDPDGSIMIPAWLLKTSSEHRIAHGETLIFATLLLFASNRHVQLASEPHASCCYAMPADVARVTGLSPSYVRRALAVLARRRLIGTEGEMTLFFGHRMMGDANPVNADAAIDVEGLWCNDAFFLPRTIARVPSATLSPAEKVFFAVLRRFEKRWLGKVTARQATLGAELGIGPRQVQKLVAALEAKGLVEVEDRRRYRRPNVMHTHVRPPWVGVARFVARAELERQRAVSERRHE